jgi:hypothetical protein
MDAKVAALEGVVPVVFSSRAQAEAAIAELRALGFADDELGVIVPDPAHHDLLDDSTHEALTGLGHGILVGAPLGAIAGIALAALAAPGVGVIGVGGALLFGGNIGALWGAITGAYLVLTAEVHHLEDVEHKYEIPLKPEEILVVVMTDPGRADAVCQIMQRHEARCVRETVVRADATA